MDEAVKLALKCGIAALIVVLVCLIVGIITAWALGRKLSPEAEREEMIRYFAGIKVFDLVECHGCGRLTPLTWAHCYWCRRARVV